MHRSLAATAKLCKKCLEAGKSLKPDIAKDNIGNSMEFKLKLKRKIERQQN